MVLNQKLNFKRMFLVIAAIFTAASFTQAIADTGKELAPLKGEWVSMTTVMDNSSLDAAYAEAAEKMPNYTAGGVKAVYKEMYASIALKAQFNGTNTVTFTVLNKAGKQEKIKCAYTYKGQIPIPGYEGHFWETFEAVKTVRGLEKAKYFIATLPHQGDDGLLHWHARFGAVSIDDLVNADSLWWPTYVKSSTKKNELIETAKKEIVSYVAANAPASPFIHYEKSGEWMNQALAYTSKAPEVEAVYTNLIKEFAGKKPEGGNFTKEEILTEVMKLHADIQDFTHVKFSTKNGVNELIFLKNGKEVFRSNYKRIEANPSKATSMAIVSDKDTDIFKLMSMTKIHGDPMHFHFWYGTNETDFAKFIKAPTCIPAHTPGSKLAEYVEKNCRYVLEKMIVSASKENL